MYAWADALSHGRMWNFYYFCTGVKTVVAGKGA